MKMITSPFIVVCDENKRREVAISVEHIVMVTEKEDHPSITVFYLDNGMTIETSDYINLDDALDDM